MAKHVELTTTSRSLGQARDRSSLPWLLSKLSVTKARYSLLRGQTPVRLRIFIVVADMVKYMKDIAFLDRELTLDERNLLLVGYKNVIGGARTSWRIVSSAEEREESMGNAANAALARGYRFRRLRCRPSRP